MDLVEEARHSLVGFNFGDGHMHNQDLIRAVQAQARFEPGELVVALSEATGGRLRPVELGRRLGWEKSRLHHQLTRMYSRGLVQRHSGDGRAIHAAITTAGRAALKAAVPRHTQQVRRLVLDRLTPQQIDQLAEISRAILDGLDRG